jgi:hypothetical protein
MSIFDSEVKLSCVLAPVIDLIRILDGDLILLGVIMILLGVSLIILESIFFDGESCALDSYTIILDGELRFLYGGKNVYYTIISEYFP